jgi:hypothetical protein
MQVRTLGVVAALMGILSLAGAQASRAECGPQDKGKKKRQETGTKVEIKDLPAAVSEAAKKEAPSANWTSAAKHSTKKQGSAYVLEGSDGKYHVTITINASGDLLRFTKASQGKKPKKAK